MHIQQLKDSKIQSDLDWFTIKGKLNLLVGAGLYNNKIQLIKSENPSVNKTSSSTSDSQSLDNTNISTTNSFTSESQTSNQQIKNTNQPDLKTTSLNNTQLNSSSQTQNVEQIRIEFSNGGCSVFFYAPSGYYWEVGDVDTQYGPTGRAGALIESGFHKFDFNNYYSGVTVIGVIRDTSSVKVLEKRFTLTNDCNVTKPDPVRIELANNGCTVNFFVPTNTTDHYDFLQMTYPKNSDAYGGGAGISNGFYSVQNYAHAGSTIKVNISKINNWGSGGLVDRTTIAEKIYQLIVDCNV